MQLTIEDDIVQALKAPEPKVEEVMRQSLAVSLYAQKLLPLGPARRLAGLTRWEFDDLLVREKISRHYTTKSLKEDAAFAQDGRPTGNAASG